VTDEVSPEFERFLEVFMDDNDELLRRLAKHEFRERLEKVAGEIGLPENMRLIVEVDQADPEGRFYMQIECDRPDTYTGLMGVGRGGKSYLSPWMTDSEIVRRAFGLLLAYVEHEAREGFMWRGRRVFGPHIHVEALWSVAGVLDVRLPIQQHEEKRRPMSTDDLSCSDPDCDCAK
jgi:hypothetical protein